MLAHASGQWPIRNSHRRDRRRHQKPRLRPGDTPRHSARILTRVFVDVGYKADALSAAPHEFW